MTMMDDALEYLALPLLRLLDPESAHGVTLRALEAGFYSRQTKPDDPRLAQSVWDLEVSNPVGLAAGFDKDARVAGAFLKMGFGFVEVGTVTPRPQPGNPKPRIFRLADQHAIINRLGFNSSGHAAVAARLAALPKGGIVGVNIGPNRDARDPAADYIAGIETFSATADYLTVNISSPNTPGLRDLHDLKALDGLLARLMEARQQVWIATAIKRPIAVKLSPDLEDAELPGIVERLLAHKVDAIIVSNSTVDREGVKSWVARETGGLSGRPLFTRSTRLLAKIYMLCEGQIPLIGVGGIDSGERALAKLQAGATLLQLYTGLVYQGPALFTRIKQALIAHMERERMETVGEITGTRAQEWADVKMSEDLKKSA